MLGPFPEFPVADGLGPADLKDSTEAGVDEHLDLVECGNCCSPYFSSIAERQSGARMGLSQHYVEPETETELSSIEQDRFSSGVEDPDLDVDGQAR